MSDLKAVMIGCGRRAAEFAAGFEEARGVSCAACADVDREQADTLAAEFELTAYYEAMEMMEVEAPDIIAIITAFDTRAKFTRMCAEKRIPAIIVETPVVRTLAEARELVQLCRTNGTRLMLTGRTPSLRELLNSCAEAVKRSFRDPDAGEPRTQARSVQPEELVGEGRIRH
ncbi:MAG: Gfo/Idh/MocA family oxidoreductase [Armatimonadota bacterium]